MIVPILIKMEFAQPRDLGITVRAWREATRAAHEDQGKYWFEKCFRRHFEGGAARKYNHRPRSRNYLKLKQMSGVGALAGGRVDNLYKGTLRATLRAGSEIRGYPTRVTIRLQSTKYAPQKPRTDKQPNKIAEIFEVTGDEAAELAKVLKESAERRFEAFRQPETVTL